eukprot:gene8098-12559_t
MNTELSEDEFRKLVFENKMTMDGKTYPIITAQDLIDKEAQGCFYCFLHSSHTPCGKQLKKWKDCTLKQPIKSEEESKEDIENENDECKPIFENEFFPCYSKFMRYPYYSIRFNVLIENQTKDKKC